MDVILAETAGFCMGVNLALSRLDSLLVEEGVGLVQTLGPIIHNPQVLDHYSKRGVTVAHGLEDITPGSAVVIRAHGVPRTLQEVLEARGTRVVDATCPKVKKAQMLIGRETERGRKLLLYGEADHSEVRGLLSYAWPDSFVFSSREEFEAHNLAPDERYVLAAQTTQDWEVFETLATDLAARPGVDLKVLQTICDATRLRQEDAVRIAREVDYMVVVGGHASGNTRRLAQVAAAQGTPCVHMEIAKELPLDELRKCCRVGLTAGASTPRELVAEIFLILRGL